MDPLIAFSIQFLMSTLVYSVLAVRWFWPWATRRPVDDAFVPMVALHALRAIGLFYAIPGTVDDTVPSSVGAIIGLGDLSTAILALAALITMRPGSRVSRLFLWAFNVVGLLDLAHGAWQGMVKYHLNAHSIPALWWIVTFLIPALLVSHVIMIGLLVRRNEVRASAM
jgi:hypothetical protein